MWLCNQCSTLVSFCRSHCYKIILIVVFFFVLTQYVTNMLVKYNAHKSISPSLSWVSDSKTSSGHGENKSTNSSGLILTNGTSTLRSNSSDSTVMSSLVLMDITTEMIKLEKCPMVPPNLVGRLKVLMEAPEMLDLEAYLPELEPGGRYHPPNCTARTKVAIIIPYRDREHHLRIFLHNIHPVLMRQQLDYGIYIVEESGKTKFNRALLMNIGFVEASKDYDYECFIFHDVDLIPEDDRNIYSCSTQPRHMSVAIDIFQYRLPYKDIFGGVSALNKSHMLKVNGFSNEYWGWGGEDDDMSNRLRFYGLKITRYPANIARYKMLKHSKDEPNPDRYNKLYKGRKRFKSDGLNNLHYKRKDFVLKKLYTWILVDVSPQLTHH